jgi:hypothetical protein
MKTTSSSDEARIFNETLRKRLKRVNELMALLSKERDAIVFLLSGSSPIDERNAKIPFESPPAAQPANGIIMEGRKGIVGKVVDFLEIHKKGARAKQIMDYLVKSGYTFADSKNPKGHLFAILSQEANDKNSRIVRVSRGLYSLRKSEG